MAKLTIPDCKNARVLVVGDVMLDRYWFGNVDRISPEAPVPIVHVQRTEERPGGAANVARNVAALGGQATLLSVVGDDEAGRSLAALLEKALVQSHTRHTENAPPDVRQQRRLVCRRRRVVGNVGQWCSRQRRQIDLAARRAR